MHPSLATNTTSFRSNGVCKCERNVNEAKVAELLDQVPSLIRPVAEKVKEAGAVAANADDAADHEDEEDDGEEEEEEEEEEDDKKAEKEKEKEDEEEDEEEEEDEVEEEEEEEEEEDTGKRQKTA